MAGILRFGAVAALGLASLLLAGPANATTPALSLTDDLAFADDRPDERATALTTARRAGARFVRITLDWSRVAPGGDAKPAGFDPSDPYDPKYHWRYVEDAVRDADRAGLRVVLVVVRAPRWAEGEPRPADAPAGSWRPDPAEFHAFMRAATRHFSGFYPDPLSTGDFLNEEGQTLPAVRHWQVWHEPNGGETLRPVADAVDRYRRLLSSARAALNRLGGDIALVAGGTATGGAIRPLRFWRRLLCLGRARCERAPRFDVVAHDPANRGAPGSRGPRSNIGLRHLDALRAALRAARLSRNKPLWVTGLGWPTRPPDRDGVSRKRQARYLVKSLYMADRAGATLVDWTGLLDRVSDQATVESISSGLMRAGSEPKPAYRAYRFPFLIRSSGRKLRAWGIAPRARRRVVIERRRGGGWRKARAVRAGGSREFSVRVPDRRGTYRARQGRATSLPWRSH